MSRLTFSEISGLRGRPMSPDLSPRRSRKVCLADAEAEIARTLSLTLARAASEDDVFQRSSIGCGAKSFSWPINDVKVFNHSIQVICSDTEALHIYTVVTALSRSLLDIDNTLFSKNREIKRNLFSS